MTFVHRFMDRTPDSIRRPRETRAPAANHAWNRFIAEFPSEAAWIIAKQGEFGFAYSMRAAVERYTRLTERQLEAVRRCMGDDQRTAAGPSTGSVTMDDRALRERLQSAETSGLRKIKLHFGNLVIQPAPATGRNPGALYVLDRGIYIGKLSGGEFVPGRDFARLEEGERIAMIDAIVAILADPAAAVRRYGHETGICSCCGRTLTDPVSIAAGIGPICASRFSF